MVKKIFLIFLHAGAIFFYFILLTSFEENHKFSNKNNHLPAWRKSEIFLLLYVLDLMKLLKQKVCQDSNLRVKLMYESVSR